MSDRLKEMQDADLLAELQVVSKESDGSVGIRELERRIGAVASERVEDVDLNCRVTKRRIGANWRHSALLEQSPARFVQQPSFRWGTLSPPAGSVAPCTYNFGLTQT